MTNVPPSKARTLVQALNEMKKNGYTANFRIENDKLIDEHGQTFSAHQVNINSFERFEGATNPSDSSILYAIETNDGIKGAVVTSYGVYSEADEASFIRKVSMS